MDDIYILACLMQSDCVLTHTSEGIFKKKQQHNMTYLKFRDAMLIMVDELYSVRVLV